MINVPRLVPLLTALVLTSCGESTAPPAATTEGGGASPDSTGMSLVAEAKSIAQESMDGAGNVDWAAWQTKLTQTDLSEARKALDGINISAAKAKYDELAGALTKKDYVQAEFYAKQFDELMSSDVAGRTITFLKLKSEKGTEAAIEAVKEYLNTPGLGESGRMFGEKMLGHIQSVEQDQVEAVLCFIVYHAVDAKVQSKGPHGNNLAAFLAVLAVSKGFDAYDLHTKDGMELSDAIFKSMGTDREEAAKAWNEIVTASKKGKEALEKELNREGGSEKLKNGIDSMLETGKKLFSEENGKMDEVKEGKE